jgi:hypothetical protein
MTVPTTTRPPRSPAAAGAPRTLERLLYFAELVLSMVAP